MNNATWAMLNETEKALLRDTERRKLEGLDQDALLDLHDRVRRIRTKYAKLYRRRAASQVESDAARGRAHATHARTAVKAEAFEDALARVSRHLARAAKASADALKGERLAAARKDRAAPVPDLRAGPARSSAKKPPSAKRKRRTPVSERASASARASTRRVQTKRASR